MPFTIGGDRIPSKQDNKPRKKVLVREHKKKGKPITLVLNLDLSPEAQKDLLRFLKQKCHCGGSIREETIELQGHKEQEVLKALKEYPSEDLNL